MNQPHDAATWHEGCQKDECRNTFIIPEIIRVFAHADTKRCAFIGSATAYIPQNVCAQHALATCWLIDPDQSRMDYSKSLDINATNVERSCETFDQCSFDQKFDTVVISNTLLEFSVEEEFARQVRAAIVKTGHLLIFLPDVLEDVVQAYVDGNRNALQEFLRGCHYMSKTDKFTLSEYNFYAHRETALIGKFLRAGFQLVEIKHSTTKPISIMMHLVATDDQ